MPSNIDNITIYSDDLPAAVNMSIVYKGVLKDVSDLEEYKEDEFYLFGGGNLYTKYKLGQILKTNYAPSDTDVARCSGFIPVAKGDTVKMYCAIDHNHYAIAFYKKRNYDSFYGGVLGSDLNTKKYYTYVAPEDGYFVVSACEYGTEGDFSDSNFTITKTTGAPKNSYIDDFNNIIPFGSFTSVKQLAIADNLDANDYRKTYPGLGYDVVWDEENNRYVMLMAGYNETIGYAQIGLMYSSDLKNWTNYGVVLSPTGIDGDPDKGSVTFPQLLRYREKWLMFYVGFDQTGFEKGVHKICYAESSNFINWTRKGVVLTREDFTTAGVWKNTALDLGKGVIYRPRVINANGKYYMFINGGPDGDADTGGPNENVYVAISDNPTKGWKVLDIVLDPEVLFPETNYKICSDPDVMFNGEDFIITWWGDGGIFVGKSNIHNFPLNWKVITLPIVSATRPLFVPTKDKLYLIANTNGAHDITLFEADWIL